MDGSSAIKSQLEMARNVHDMGSLNQLRSAANTQQEGALEEAAAQFEAIFINMLLKSMRKAQEALADEDSPFNSQQVKFYRDMHDQQVATDLASNGTLGLADIIVRQLSNEHLTDNLRGSRSDGDIAGYNQQMRHAIEQAKQQFETSPTANRKQAAFASPEAFVEQLYPLAKEHAQALGIDPKALVAQAAVETGWGQFMIHKTSGENTHNLFGIKADKRWDGEKATVQTLEYNGAVAQQEKAHFRAYANFAEGMRDYVNFIQSNPRYEQAVANAHDNKAYFSHLQQSGYATDPKYADKILSVLNSATLQQYSESE
ncbi:flagellar assembly peptidoglycan hydrolase FlgJ [Alteromonas facilis]|uniref:flagellar assembly peptidoglycan hydrolase FlgJ n=1 Tax=Alteromonas facilis TaxID=2048004 RepID=UPI000C293CA3|nr:flagellar assembly peptidoglycan hydrolase FlgJ [Alteromonas facilis]